MYGIGRAQYLTYGDFNATIKSYPAINLVGDFNKFR